MTRIYQVKQGESLKSIAAALLGNKDRWPELAHVNHLAHPYFIRTGQVLELPDTEQPVTVITASNSGAPAARQVKNQLSPAEWGLLAVGAFVIWRYW